MHQPVRTRSLVLLLSLMVAGATGLVFAPSRVQEEGSVPLPGTRPLLTIAHEILDIEARALPTSAAQRSLLDATIANAAASVRGQAHQWQKLEPREQALSVLQIIAASLRDGHFVYPGRGSVPTLHDALTPVTVDGAGLERLIQAPENAQAERVLRGNPRGVFHVADCDIFSILYVAIGQALGLPIAMVELPPPAFGPRHVYVRMSTLDGEHVAWEAMSGTERDSAALDARFFAGATMPLKQAQTARAFAMPLSHDEMLGYAHTILGEVWQGLGADDRALAAYQASIAKRPSAPMAYNEAAWLLATSSNPRVRNASLAFEYAKTLISLWPSAVHFDTMAAAYAASGEFKAAVNAQGTAIASTNPHDPRLAEFRRRCVSYSSN